MISYLVDAVLLIALAFTSLRVTRMHRELNSLRNCHDELSTIVDAFDAVIEAAQESTANLTRLASVLSSEIDQAESVIVALDASKAQFLGAARRHADEMQA